MRALSTLRRTTFLAFAGAVAAGALLLSTPAAAQAPPLKLALQVSVMHGPKGEKAVAESIARQVVTHLTPQLESRGWNVVRVFSAARAVDRKRCHAAVRIDLNARTVYHLNDARLYEDEQGRTLVTDHSRSAEAWGTWTVWDGMTRRVILDGTLGPIVPQLQGAGAGRPELDDEPSIARLVADAAAASVTDALGYARATQP